MAKDILKEAIADAKAVREVALANAKAALEEAFTPKLQSMLSARLSEDMDEEMMDEEMDEDMDETMYNEEDMEETSHGMEEDMDETYMDEEMDETVGMEKEEKEMEEDLDEEIDLEEILNELELEEAKDEDKDVKEAKHDDDVKKEAKDMDEEKDDMKEAKDDDDMKEAKDDEKNEEKLDEMGRPIYKAGDANYAGYTADRVHEDEEFDLDSLLKEIESLEEKEDVDEGDFGEAKDDMDEISSALGVGTTGGLGSSGLQPMKGETMANYEKRVKGKADRLLAFLKANPKAFAAAVAEEVDMSEELEETKAALETVRTELNEVNLLNSKLLYVNRIFKANTLNESQKLRVVETLDKAESTKEAKLIYETIKDTFSVAKSKKASFKNKTKSLKEGIGMASKAAGTSTAPKQEVISESNNMVNRFQKLANIKINE
jgi:hypothetical protein